MQTHMKKAAIVATAFCMISTGIVAAHEESEHHKHQSVKLADIPQAARDALEREANGKELKNVRKETRHGEICYEADVTENGKTSEIEVTADGKNVTRENEGEGRTQR